MINLGCRRERLVMDMPVVAAPSWNGAVTLDPEQSATLREKLLTELGNITSADLAAVWAREALSAKNSLTAPDAKLVEDAFERRLSELPSSDAAAPSNGNSSVPQS